jgi:hypothetical protein
MHIPRIWAKAQSEDDNLIAWGWGEDPSQAEHEAKTRLERMVERVRRGEPFPAKYTYGTRPMREEILETIGGEADPRAIVTRNKYGAKVLNAARLLFLDIDLDDDSAVSKIRDMLARSGKGAFRLYRTAAGFRALALDREFDPTSREAQDLMKAMGTDPDFVKLCLAQKSFRARLTPKPWRAEVKAPKWDYPRDPGEQRDFEEWLEEYEQACKRYVTCKYLETVGRPDVAGSPHQDLIDLHDRETRVNEDLPLA